MANSRTITSRLFKVAEPNEFNATHVKRTITYEPKLKDLYGRVREAGYYMQIQMTECRLEDGYRVETCNDLVGSMNTLDFIILEYANRYSESKAKEVLDRYTDVGFIERYCQRYHLRLTSDPLDSEYNDPAFNMEYSKGGYTRFANLDVKEKTYNLIYRDQSLKGVKEKDLPHNMQKNGLKKGEGLYYGNITLLRTQDKKFKVYDPSFGVNGLDNYSATRYGIMNYFAKNHIGPDNYDRFVELLWNTGIEDTIIFNGDRILIGCKCDDYSFEPGNKSLAQLHVPRPTQTQKPQPKRVASKCIKGKNILNKPKTTTKKKSATSKTKSKTGKSK